MSSEQRTEQPTQRRKDKARKEGRSGTSSDALIAVQLIASYYLGRYWLESAVPGLVFRLRRIFASSFTISFTPVEVWQLYREVAWDLFAPLIILGFGLTLTTLVFQLVIAQVPVALSKLGFDAQRFSPISKAGSLPKQNMVAFAKSLLIAGLFLMVSSRFLFDESTHLMRASAQSIPSGLAHLSSTCRGLFLRLIGCAAFVGMLDFSYQSWQFRSSLKMTKQEVRDEQKESEGRPEVKMQLRKLRRDLRRRRMMQDVPKATFVVVNPTHFAVAIRYQMDTMAAPVVVAKGKNYVALRIRTMAIHHQVPIIENPPLAQALYKSASVGQEIPPQLYQAVAEILAYIYRLLNGRLPG